MEASMKKLLKTALSAKRKRRGLVLSIALWLLRVVRDIEKEEMYRFEFECNAYDRDSESDSTSTYEDLEGEWSLCECALGFVDCAVNDLEYLFGGFVYE
jgi:hypothetical protein